MEDEAYKKKSLEEEVAILQSQLLQLTFEAGQVQFDLEISSGFLFCVRNNLLILRAVFNFSICF